MPAISAIMLAMRVEQSKQEEKTKNRSDDSHGNERRRDRSKL